MTQQIINVGSAPNDGTGDPARNAFDKCNLNFTELYQVSRPTGNAIEYQFNNTTTEPPSSAQIRFNQATQASTTKIWASHTTSSGVNIKQFLAAATTGAKLIVQDKNDNTNYIKFDVTGAPVDKTTYWEFAVAVTASGGNLPNAAILAAVTAATGSVGAAPLDALAYNGMQVNGSMEVSQELGTTGPGTAVTNAFVLDCWKILRSPAATGRVDAKQVASGGLFSGFQFYLGVTVPTAQPTIGTDQFLVRLAIEGYRVARLAWGTVGAQPITIGFWTAHNRTGTYSLALGNWNGDRSYVTSYTQSVAGVAEYKVITIPGDTTGTWEASNLGGLYLYFLIASASGTASVNTWFAGADIAAPGQINGIAATSDVFCITGVVVLPGILVPTAAQSPFIMRPYDQELVICQRYFEWCPFNYYWHNPIGTGAGDSVTLRFAVDKRAAPTLSTVFADPSASPATANYSLIDLSRPTLVGCQYGLTSAAGGPTYILGYRFSADARL